MLTPSQIEEIRRLSRDETGAADTTLVMAVPELLECIDELEGNLLKALQALESAYHWTRNKGIDNCLWAFSCRGITARDLENRQLAKEVNANIPRK